MDTMDAMHAMDAVEEVVARVRDGVNDVLFGAKKEGTEEKQRGDIEEEEGEEGTLLPPMSNADPKEESPLSLESQLEPHKEEEEEEIEEEDEMLLAAAHDTGDRWQEDRHEEVQRQLVRHLLSQAHEKAHTTISDPPRLEHAMLLCNSHPNPERAMIGFDALEFWRYVLQQLSETEVNALLTIASENAQAVLEAMVMRIFPRDPATTIQKLGVAAALRRGISGAVQHLASQPQLSAIAALRPQVVPCMNMLLVNKMSGECDVELPAGVSRDIVRFLSQGTLVVPWEDLAEWIEHKVWEPVYFEKFHLFDGLLQLVVNFLGLQGLFSKDGGYPCRDVIPALTADICAFVCFVSQGTTRVAFVNLPDLFRDFAAIACKLPCW